ncbi:hypothetical protein H4R18_002331 [Coemansia javaensis]|uniref:Methyltransferase domain-containing protein n=1 Tax=Coemansia javaensis TaxID=2761396 RepID=A0A9W8HIQ9_9FUNG|nr:hypothetical protein H4R18_002331 [Coemansia javaensis]
MADLWLRVVVAAALVVALGAWQWQQRRARRSGSAPAAVFVPSTSTYPSAAYTARRKVAVQRVIGDFLGGRIELRDAQSGHGLADVGDVVAFGLGAGLAWRLAGALLLGASHSAERDQRNAEQFVVRSGALLEDVLGPDRLPLVGYMRDGMPERLEDSLGVQIERVGREYLDLGPDDRLLDVSAQWGDLAVHLAHRFRVPTCAIVPTAHQLAHATTLAGESQAQRFLRFATGDYRAVPRCLAPGVPPFTKVLALDALDAVGARNIPRFLRTVGEAMEPGARLLLQPTTTPSSVARRWAAAAIADDAQDSDPAAALFPASGAEARAELWWYHWFRQRYIQPGADTPMTTTIEQVLGELQRAGFEVLQLESLTADAAQTAAVWCSRLCAAKRQIEAEMDELTYRAWQLYLNWTQSLYARARLHKHFILAVKRV